MSAENNRPRSGDSEGDQTNNRSEDTTACTGVDSTGHIEASGTGILAGVSA